MVGLTNLQIDPRQFQLGVQPAGQGTPGAPTVSREAEAVAGQVSVPQAAAFQFQNGGQGDAFTRTETPGTSSSITGADVSSPYGNSQNFAAAALFHVNPTQSATVADAPLNALTTSIARSGQASTGAPSLAEQASNPNLQQAQLPAQQVGGTPTQPNNSLQNFDLTAFLRPPQQSGYAVG